jgi:hypothetical protein
MPFAEIELALNPLGSDLYQLDLRANNPLSDAAIAPAAARVQISADALGDLADAESLPAEYSAKLTALLFADADLRVAWASARAAFAATDLDIRMRLLLAPTDATLHTIRWELLCDPQTNELLAFSPRILFSRLLFSRDFRPIRLRARAELSLTIAVAAPEALAESFSNKFAPVDRNLQIDQVRAALPTLTPTVVEHPLTLDALVKAFERAPDILYLACHGTIAQKAPHLLLCDAAGKVLLTHARELTDRLARLNTLPRLVVLASCQSAGFAETAQDSLAALLAEAGIPAVIAMQGNITMKSIGVAMPVFFTELLKDGQIDRAFAHARFAVRASADAWMPVLLLRLKSGRIWYDPGFSSGKATSDFWDEIRLQITTGNALPIIGPDLAEDVLASSTRIAETLAKNRGFPLSNSDRSDLAKVAQYLTIAKGPTVTSNDVATLMLLLAQRLNPATSQFATLDGVYQSIGAAEANKPTSPTGIVARLPLTTFVDASSNRLLFHTLKAVGKQPVVANIPWRPTPTEPSPRAVQTNESQLAPNTPIVYDIFGNATAPQHWVLTEDDFFDFTVRASQYSLLPLHLKRLFSMSSLLFLGFSLHSWTFRALFRMIMLQEGIAAFQRGKTHIGVQVDPEDSRFADPEKARQYLTDYFLKSDRRGSGNEPQIDIYWGSSAEFLRELNAHMAQAPKFDLGDPNG